MRKHFLLLFLMALLPLAGWAENVDISGATVVITLEKNVGNYNDKVQLPQINTVKVGDITYYASQWPQYFTPKYYKKVGDTYVAQNADQIQDAGTYGVRMVANGATDAENGKTYIATKESSEDSREDFVINKIDLKISLENGSKQYGANDPNSLEYTLIDLPDGYAVPTLTFAALPITGAHAAVSSAGYDYNFKLNNNTQTDITAVNYNIIITNQPKLIVTKKRVALDYNNAATAALIPVKTYGIEAINETFTAGIAAAANYALANEQVLENEDQLATVLAGLNADKVTFAYKYAGNKESANVKDDANLTALENPAAHKVTITLDENVAANYLFTVNDVDLKVKQAKLTVGQDSKFTFTKTPTTNLTYNGAAQSVKKKLVYNGTQDITVLDETVTPAIEGQFVISYKYKTASTSDEEKTIGNNENQVKDGTAGYYVAYATAVANKNFYTEGDAAIAVPTFNFTIDKKPMFVYVTEPAIEVYYKGSEYTLPVYDANTSAITFQNMVTADKVTLAAAMAAVVTKTVATATEPASAVVTNAKVYNIAPVIPDNSALKENYTVTPLTTTFEVKANPITIAPRDMLDVVYKTQIAGSFNATVDDDTDPLNPVVGNVTVVKTTEKAADVTDADLAIVLSAYNVVVADQTYAAGGEYPGAITLVQKTNLDENVTNLLANFDITSTATGKVTIGPGSYMLVVREKNITYGDDLAWGDFSYFTPMLDAGKSPASVKYMLIDDADNSKKYYQATSDELPTNAGTYTIKVDVENSDIEIKNYTTPTEENGNLVSATLTIAPKVLTITTGQVTVNEGATPAALNTLGRSKVSFDALEKGDQIAFNLAFNTQGSGAVQVDNVTGNLASLANADAYAAGYKIVALTPEEIAAAEAALGIKFANANYAFKFGDADPVLNIETANATGALKVDDAALFTLDNTVADLQTVLDVAGGTPNATVQFGEEIPMAAKEWRAMVLPFDITPAELVKTLGVYVVVNKFKSAAYDSKKPTKVNVNFALEMDKIDAGVPFLIKPAANINWIKDAENHDIKFTEKTIVARPIAQGQGAATPTDDKATFTGTYNLGEILWWGHNLDGTENPGMKSKWLCYNGATRYAQNDPTTEDGTYTTTTEKSENTWKEPETRPHLLSPMEAYVLLDADATEARVFVEDIENGVTSIKELGVDGTAKAYSVDGWYTLDGVKLQSAPAQKGIYINNGKKVVIK